MTNRAKILIALTLLAGLVLFGYSSDYFDRTSIDPPISATEPVDYYGYHGKVLVVNNVVFRKKGPEREERNRFALLKIGEDKVYGQVEGYNGYETRTNEPNNRYFIQLTTHKVNGEDVAARASLLIYLDKEDWELFSPE